MTDVKLNDFHRELTRTVEGRNRVKRARYAEREIGYSEIIFEVPTENPRVSVLVYTSYDPEARALKGEGNDAVKFVVRYVGHERTRFVGNLQKVHRTGLDGNGGTERFYERVVNRVATIIALAVPVRRCSCGSILVPRWAKKKGKWFLGCLDLCGHSMDVDIKEA